MYQRILAIIMTAPTLYVFSISHYCEKARWALDYRGIDYELRYLAPGEHIEVAKRLRVPRSSVPYLVIGDRAIQGSTEIINWAESLPSASGPRLTPDVDIETAVDIETRADDVVGVHVRRYYYSEALIEHPDTVRPILTNGISLFRKLLIRIAWGKIRSVMIKRMDLGQIQGRESEEIVDHELANLDALLADGRQYLVGDRFSRADLTVCSLLSPLLLPAEHPTYSGLKLPPRLDSTVAEWQQRPSLCWVRDIYARHRLQQG